MATKAEANYRGGSPIKCCGLCKHYKGASCDVVEGTISPFMISDSYNPHPKPKGVPAYRSGGNGQVGVAARPAAPKAQIGNKTYD